MKKFLTLALAVLMVAALAVSASAANNAGLTYTAPYANITVDGVIDAAWDNATWATIDNGHSKGTTGGKFKVMHDDTWIYFLGQFDDTTGLDAKKNENFRVGLHLDNCGATIGKECANGAYDSYIMNRKADGIWAVISNQSVEMGEDKDIYFVVNTEGTVHTWEARFKAVDAIAAGIAGIEVRLDDYKADGSWIGDKAWNTYGDNSADEPGALYLLEATGNETPADTTKPAEDNTPADSDNTPADSDNTPADTTKPAETPTTDKVPTTADAGLAIAAVVMAAAAMVVLTKKH